jgi:hypothetical protein
MASSGETSPPYRLARRRGGEYEAVALAAGSALSDHLAAVGVAPGSVLLLDDEEHDAIVGYLRNGLPQGGTGVVHDGAVLDAVSPIAALHRLYAVSAYLGWAALRDEIEAAVAELLLSSGEADDSAEPPVPPLPGLRASAARVSRSHVTGAHLPVGGGSWGALGASESPRWAAADASTSRTDAAPRMDSSMYLSGQWRAWYAPSDARVGGGARGADEDGLATGVTMPLLAHRAAATALPDPFGFTYGVRGSGAGDSGGGGV